MAFPLLALTLSTATISSIDPLITLPALADHLNLKRTIESCGWVSGNSAWPLTCPEGYSCTAINAGRFACCNDVECPGDYVYCQGHGAPDMCSGLDTAVCSSIYGGSILTCPADAPNCVQYLLSASLRASTTYGSLTCGTATGPVLALASVTGVQTGRTTQTAQIAQSSASASLATLTGGLGAAPTTTQYTPASSGSTAGSTDGTTSTSSKGLSTGVIAGIVIVGIAVLVVAAIVLFFCIRCFGRTKRRAHDIAAPPQPMQQFPDDGTVITDYDRVQQWNMNTHPPSQGTQPSFKSPSHNTWQM